MTTAVVGRVGVNVAGSRVIVNGAVLRWMLLMVVLVVVSVSIRTRYCHTVLTIAVDRQF